MLLDILQCVDQPSQHELHIPNFISAKVYELWNMILIFFLNDKVHDKEEGGGEEAIGE